MNELIKIRNSTRTGNPVISARDLYKFLGARKDFSNWFKSKVESYDLIENHDFVPLFFAKNGDRIQLAQKGEVTTSDTQKVYKIEYALTLDCAKQLAMANNNKRGTQARKYFTEVEKKYQAVIELKPELMFTMSEVARKLSLVDYYGKIGRNALYNILYHHKIVDMKNQPLQKYVKKGYFICKPTRVTEIGLRWLSQMFSIGNGENIELRSKIEKIESEQNIMLQGVTALVETLLYNKGGKLTEEKNRLAVSHLRNYLDKASDHKKLLVINN